MGDRTCRSGTPVTVRWRACSPKPARQRLRLTLVFVVATLVASPPWAQAAAPRSPSPVTIGILARSPDGWAKVPVYRAPGDAKAFTSLGDRGGPPPVVLVTEPPVDGWAHVLLPIRDQPSTPGPATGWVSTDGIRLNDAPYRVDVLVAEHRVVVTRNGQTIRTMSAATGRPDTPTPAVVSFVVGINKPIVAQQTNSPLGPFTLHLAAWSTVLPDYTVDPAWNGIVIQGTNCPTTCLGHSITNGSIRVSNNDVTWLARNLPVGTPVIIR